MGIVGLWAFVNGRGCVESLGGEALALHVDGKTIAVDVATWLVQSRLEKSYEHEKRHIRVVFERLSHWLRMGIVPVLVFDGVMPPAKTQTLQKRGFRVPAYRGADGDVLFMSKYRTMIEETKTLARALGVACVQASGEAEAACALLNRLGKVDAVASNDGDALLFGVRQLYKGLRLHVSLKAKDGHEAELVDCAAVAAALEGDGAQAAGAGEGIEAAMVAVALISGADYLVDGIKSHGPARAIEVVRALQRRRRQRQRQQKEGGPAPRLLLLDLLRKALATPVDEALVASSGQCTTCRLCRHGATGKQRHGTHGCEECGTNLRSKGGNGEGGCLPRPLLEGESCPCEPCRRSDERLLHKLADAARSPTAAGGGGGIGFFLQRFDRARQAYEAALAEEAQLRALPGFTWKRPNYTALKSVLQQVYGLSGKGDGNIARKAIPLLCEYDARHVTATQVFVPVAIHRLSGRGLNKEKDEKEWRYEMTFRPVGEGVRVLADAAAGKGLSMPSTPDGAALEGLTKQVLDAGLGTLRKSLVDDQYPALVEAYEMRKEEKEEKKKQQPPAKPKKSKTAVSRTGGAGASPCSGGGGGGQTKLPKFFSVLTSPCAAAASAAASSSASASASSSSSSSAMGTPPAATMSSPPPLPSPSQLAPISVSSSPPSFIEILDTPPSAVPASSAAAAASSRAAAPPPFTPAKPPRSVGRIPDAPRKGKRPAGLSLAEAEAEAEDGGGFGSGAVQNLTGPLKRACRPPSFGAEEENEEEEEEEVWDFTTDTGIPEEGSGAQAALAAAAAEKDEDDEVAILEASALVAASAATTAPHRQKEAEVVDLTTP